MRFAALFCLLCLFLLPSPARSQSYTSTSSSLSYGYYGGQNQVQMLTEWFYDTNAGNWFFSSCSFDLTVSVFESHEDYENGNALSTNLTNYPCWSGSWSWGGYAPGVGRVYGERYVTLTEGFVYHLSMTPKTSGSRYVYPGPANYFTWPGQSKGILVDLLHP